MIVGSIEIILAGGILAKAGTAYRIGGPLRSLESFLLSEERRKRALERSGAGRTLHMPLARW